jgi:hypothetical protein
MMPIALFSLLIGIEDACLPVGREEPPYRGETKHPIIKYALVASASKTNWWIIIENNFIIFGHEIAVKFSSK